MNLWHRLTTDCLRDWAEGCERLIAATELEIVERTMDNKKPTAGQLAVQDIQGRQLAFIRRELDRRENV